MSGLSGQRRVWWMPDDVEHTFLTGDDRLVGISERGVTEAVELQGVTIDEPTPNLLDVWWPPRLRGYWPKEGTDEPGQ